METKKGTDKEKSFEFLKTENRALKVLYDMHKSIENEEIFKGELYREGIDVITALLSLSTESEKQDNEIRFYIDLIYLQIKVNDLFQEQAEYEKLKEAYYDAERKLKIYFQSAKPDQQATLGQGI